MRDKGRLLEYLSKLDSLPDFTREAAGLDTLFEAEYEHAGKGQRAPSAAQSIRSIESHADKRW
jgi:hypothetical protein